MPHSLSASRFDWTPNALTNFLIPLPLDSVWVTLHSYSESAWESDQQSACSPETTAI